MDPITTSIIAAIPFIAEKVGGNLVSDGYGTLKGWIKNRLGAQHPVVEAIQKVEQNQTDGRKLTLHEEVVACGLERDAEALRMAAALSELVKKEGGTVTITTINVETAIGSTIIGSQHNHR